MYVRVAVTGRILIVTVTGASSTATTPVGRASLASTVSSSDTPVIEMGSVSTRVRSTSWSASPATRTTWGTTVTESISKPAAGTPVMMALTGRVRLCWSEKTGMTTRAVCRRDLERPELVAELVDGHELDVLVEVDAGRLDRDVGPDRVHLVDDRGGAGHGDDGRVDRWSARGSARPGSLRGRP